VFPVTISFFSVHKGYSGQFALKSVFFIWAQASHQSSSCVSMVCTQIHLCFSIFSKFLLFMLIYF